MYYLIEHLPEEILIELYYELQKDKDRQNILELPLWFETITEEDSLFKVQSIDTDKEELDIKVLLSDILRDSERDTIAALYKADKGKLSKIYNELKDKEIEDKEKEVNNGSYIYMKSTLPVLVKAITSAEVDLIVKFKTKKANRGLLASILSSGQAGVNRAYKDAGLKNPYNLSTSKFADAYRDRARKFSEAVSDNVQSRVRGEIVAGIKAGEGVNDIANRIRETYKKPIAVEVAGTKDRKGYTRVLDNKKWSQMVAQTETSWAANQGRLDAYKQSDLVKNVKWITRFNPCDYCASLRGRILTLDEATNMIPVHPHCHCSYVVNEYKEREEKPETGFENTADKIYASPNGIGIMEMMKMSKVDDAKFMALLEANKIKEAEKMLRRYHYDYGLATFEQINPIELDKIVDTSTLSETAISTVKSILKSDRTVSVRIKDELEPKITIKNTPAKIKYMSEKEIIKEYGQDGKFVAGFYENNSDTISIKLKEGFNFKNDIDKAKALRIAIHETIHSYGNISSSESIIEGFTDLSTSLILEKSGHKVISTYAIYEKESKKALAVMSNFNPTEAKRILKEIVISKDTDTLISNYLSKITKRNQKEIMTKIQIRGIKGMSDIVNDYLKQEAIPSSNISQVIYNILKSISKIEIEIFDLMNLINIKTKHIEIIKIKDKILELYEKLSKEDQLNIELAIGELIVRSHE